MSFFFRRGSSDINKENVLIFLHEKGKTNIISSKNTSFLVSMGSRVVGWVVRRGSVLLCRKKNQNKFSSSFSSGVKIISTTTI